VDARRLLKQELRELGPIRRPEMTVLLIFVCAVVLWMTRSLPIGTQGDYGWAALLARWFAQVDGAPPRIRVDAVNDATIAIGMAVLLFLIPAGRVPDGSRGALMDWETARRLPWDILLLFGGGFAIAEAFEETGLSHWCGQTLSTLGISAPLALVIATCLLVTFLTELTSNTATAQVMLPIMANLGQAAGIHPLLLMLAATVSASFAFMLPVGTPPNAIVFASGHIELKQMIRTGLILNLIGVVLVTAAMFLIAKPLLGLR
jgi:sodium-dependent dicarboxylate transporter 2/3/5